MELGVVVFNGSDNSNKKTWEESIYWTHFQTVSFAVILPQDFNTHLIIPKKFTENVKRRLPDKVYLRGPSADSHYWGVQLSTDNNTTSFVGDAWKEFVTAYNLKENDLLNFKYENSNYFIVSMYDAQTCWVEKESSYFVKKSDAMITDHSGKRQENVANSRQVSSTQVSTGKNEANDQNPRRGDPKEGVVRYTCEDFVDNSDEEDQIITENSDEEDDLEWTPAKRSRKEEYKCKDTTFVHDESGDHLKSVRRLRSREPTTSPKAVGKDVRRDMGHQTGNSIPTRPKNVLKAQQGNDPSKYANTRRQRGPTAQEKTLVMQRACQETTKESFFLVMTHSLVHGTFQVYPPKWWTEKFMPDCHVDVILRRNEQEIDKEWRARYNFNKKKRSGLFINGWKKFVLDNGVHEHDVCLFKLAGRKAGNICVDVKILRAVEEEGDDMPSKSDSPRGSGQENGW